MQCSLCKVNGNSSSFIPSPSSESVDKCDIVDAIDVDVLDRNEEGDEEEDSDDGVDGVLGDDGDIEEEDGEAYGGVPTAPTLPEATLLLEADDEAGDEEGVSDDSVLSNPVLTQTISSAHRRNFHAFIIFNALSCILPSPFPIHKNTNALSEVTAFKSSLATSRQFIFDQSGLMTTTSNVPKFSLVNSHVFALSIFTLSGTCACALISSLFKSTSFCKAGVGMPCGSMIKFCGRSPVTT